MLSSSRPVAVVTGAARGIGAAVAEGLAAAGWDLVLADVARPDTVPGLTYDLATERDLADGRGHARSSVRGRSGQPATSAMSTTCAVSWSSRARSSRGGRGGRHLASDGPAWEQSAADLDRDLSVNLHGVANLARAAVPRLLSSPEPARCRFVAVVSSAAGRGLPRLASDVAAKHAALGYVRSLAATWRPLASPPTRCCPAARGRGSWRGPPPPTACPRRTTSPPSNGSAACWSPTRSPPRWCGCARPRPRAPWARPSPSTARSSGEVPVVTRLVDARWPDVEVAGRQVLIVPIGALEQHGPHLPLDCDAFIAAAVAERVHNRRPDAGLAPVLPIGASGEHADFPGTLSIGTQALRPRRRARAARRSALGRGPRSQRTRRQPGRATRGRGPVPLRGPPPRDRAPRDSRDGRARRPRGAPR